MVTEWDILLRMAVSAVLGGLIGFERQQRDKPAGIRTHALVAGGAALFVGVTLLLWADLEAGGEQPPRLDVSRVIAAVVTGVGFLGAGSIIRHGRTVKGLTTGAGIWAVAAIGVTIAFGYWWLGLAASVAVLIIHWTDDAAHRFGIGVTDDD